MATTQLPMPALLQTASIKRLVQKAPDSLDEYLVPLQGLLEDFKYKIAQPLLTSRDFAQTYEELKPLGESLLLAASERSGGLLEVHPELATVLNDELVRLCFTIDEKGAAYLEDELDTLKASLQLFSNQVQDSLRLSTLEIYLNDTERERADTIATENFIDLELQLLPVVLLVSGDIEVDDDQVYTNVRLLTRSAAEAARRSIQRIGSFLQEVLASPLNSQARHEYYSGLIERFEGKGPPGLVEALLLERREDTSRG